MALIQKFKTEIRFIIVGAWNTVLGYLLFLLFLYLFQKTLNNVRLIYLLTVTLSHFSGVILAYINHKFFTFKSKTKGRQAAYEFLRFFKSYIITFILNISLVSLQVEVLNYDTIIAGAVAIPICVVVNYFLLSKYSFRNSDRDLI